MSPQGEVKALTGVVGRYEIYDTGSSKLTIDIGPVARSLVILWAWIDMSATGPEPRPFAVSVKEGSPWVEVGTVLGGAMYEYAIWRANGDIYRVHDGAVGDEPVLAMS